MRTFKPWTVRPRPPDARFRLDLHRIAVGEHILLGGDNMDLALAYALKEQLASEGKDIDH